MTRPPSVSHVLLAIAVATALAADARAQAQAPFEPTVGQAGKDVVWVPTPEALVEKMLDMAGVGPSDLVMDLGSGDGRNVIAAAKRGARAVGVEFNPDMVELSRRRAAEAGVDDLATFVQGDMFTADVSKATVLALFLLPLNMDKLAPTFMGLAPGSRIVSNTFGIDGWDADRTESITAEGCKDWCTALLWIVPAKVYGTWESPHGQLVLKQDYQVISGTLADATGVTDLRGGRMRGDALRFRAGDREYVARVTGDTMEGTVTVNGRQEAWAARRRP